MSTINELTWASLTAAVNEIKSPLQYLKRLLFGYEDPKPTEAIELSLLTGDREVAPFVRKNGEAIMVGGIGEEFQTIAPANIRIKRPMTPSEILFKRRPGTAIFVDAGDMSAAIMAHIARDAQHMADMITNAEEYLVSMALQGKITYETADEEVFQITFPRAAGNTITLSTFWDDATPANVAIEQDVLAVKRVLSDAGCPAPTDAICGEEAAPTFLTLMKKQGQDLLNVAGITVGGIDFTSQFRDDGVLYLGTAFGLRWWEYGRKASVDGTDTSMIRPKYVEFVSTSPASERVMYYGAIPDWKALQGRLWVGRRFSKSWEEEDPSVQMMLIHSRPLPCPRRPNATVSVKVVSG